MARRKNSNTNTHVNNTTKQENTTDKVDQLAPKTKDVSNTGNTPDVKENLPAQKVVATEIVLEDQVKDIKPTDIVEDTTVLDTDIDAVEPEKNMLDIIDPRPDDVIIEHVNRNTGNTDKTTFNVDPSSDETPVDRMENWVRNREWLDGTVYAGDDKDGMRAIYRLERSFTEVELKSGMIIATNGIRLKLG